MRLNFLCFFIFFFFAFFLFFINTVTNIGFKLIVFDNLLIFSLMSVFRLDHSFMYFSNIFVFVHWIHIIFCNEWLPWAFRLWKSRNRLNCCFHFSHDRRFCRIYIWVLLGSQNSFLVQYFSLLENFWKLGLLNVG